MLNIRELTAYLYVAPLRHSLVASLFTMKQRASLFIKLTDESGLSGWGEVWCNFPEHGGEYRLRILESIFVPLIIGLKFAHPKNFFDYLSKKTQALALQCAEIGPFSHIISGIDIALWDIYSKCLGLPLYKTIADNPGKTRSGVKVYASGLNPDNAIDLIAMKRGEGYKNFKVKIGFGLERDCSLIESCLSTLNSDESLAVDANQAWSFNEAQQAISVLSQYPLEWIEEPIKCNSPLEMWYRLSKTTIIPLAAGENLYGFDSFAEAINANVVSVFQPDVCKWGGITGCINVGNTAIKARKRYCPHYLGGALGQMASAHLLAGIGGSGLLEVDANDNPLRQSVLGEFLACQDGHITLHDFPGLCQEPNLESIKEFLKHTYTYSRRVSA